MPKQREETRKVAYGYTRISSVRQSDLSLEGQAERIKSYYDMFLEDKYEWGGIFQETKISGWKNPFAQRGAGRALLEVLKEGDVMMATSLDRITRTPLDTWKVVDYLERRKANLIVVDVLGETIDTSTFTGKMFVNNMAMAYYLEVEFRAQRARNGWKHRKIRAGKRACGPKWGYVKDKDGFFIPDKKKIPLARKAYNLRRSGLTWDKVRAALEEEYCQKRDIPFKDSEFHDWHYSRREIKHLVHMYDHYLNLNAS